MSIKEQIKSVLQEAEIYRTQGLLNEAMVKYKIAADLVEKNVQHESRLSLLDGITKKIDMLKQTISKYNDPEKMPKMPVEIQNLIKDKFAFSADKESAVLEGAIALSKFGQFERAITEFNELLRNDSLKLVAAKNILRCYFSISSVEEAISKYVEWIDSGIFQSGQIEKIRFFLENLLKDRGVEKEFPIPEIKTAVSDDTAVYVKEAEEAPALKAEPPAALPVEEEEMEEDEFLDINSVGITVSTGPQKSREVVLDVAFQSGKSVSLIVPGREKALIDTFKVGLKLENVQFYSPIAILNGSGLISAFTKIISGPKMGSYSLDLKISS
jgi:tetratricopeptide (TPR) repeat protein